MRYVIIGNSAAGVAAAEGIRSRDKSGEIVMISEEKFPAYGRPLISYYLLGATDRAHMDYRPSDFYEKNGITLRLGVRAEKIDPVGHTVLLSDGSEIGYDRLLAATGSRSFVPPAEGLSEVKAKYTFMTLADALALEKALSKKKEVLIVGAGLIGLKCMEGILGRVKKVTVIDMADRVLSSILDEKGSQIVQRQLEARGVRFVLSDSVVRFEEGRAKLKSGGEIAFDLLVMAVGVRPNIELVKEAGGKTDRGIVTDEGMRTSLPDVYAAGDCAESSDIASGKRRILALLPNAYRQGYCAGENMAGGDARFGDAMPLNAIGFFGSHILTAGAYEGESFISGEGDIYRRFFVKDGVLKGFILIGAPERAGIYTALVRERRSLSEVDFEMLKTEPRLSAFSAEERKKALAAEV